MREPFAPPTLLLLLLCARTRAHVCVCVCVCARPSSPPTAKRFNTPRLTTHTHTTHAHANAQPTATAVTAAEVLRAGYNDAADTLLDAAECLILDADAEVHMLRVLLRVLCAACTRLCATHSCAHTPTIPPQHTRSKN